MEPEGYPRERHLPAVQVARDGDRRGGEFVRLDVVTALEGDAGLGRYGKAAVEADGLRDVLLVSFGRVIARRYVVVDGIVEPEVPRQREIVDVYKRQAACRSS